MELPPEGNAHQAEFTIDDRFIIGTDEDFSPYKLFMSIAGGAAAPVSAGTATPLGDDVYIDPGETLTAPTTFLGTACGTIEPPATDPAIAVVERGESRSNAEAWPTTRRTLRPTPAPVNWSRSVLTSTPPTTTSGASRPSLTRIPTARTSDARSSLPATGTQACGSSWTHEVPPQPADGRAAARFITS